MNRQPSISIRFTQSFLRTMKSWIDPSVFHEMNTKKNITGSLWSMTWKGVVKLFPPASLISRETSPLDCTLSISQGNHKLPQGIFQWKILSYRFLNETWSCSIIDESLSLPTANKFCKINSGILWILFLLCLHGLWLPSSRVLNVSKSLI